MLVVCDIETDLLVNPTTIHCIVCREVDSGEVRSFIQPLNNPEVFLEYAARVSGWIGHNFLGFDAPVLNHFFNRDVVREGSIIDTLVVARTVNYTRPEGHSLEAYGNTYSIPKVPIEDFSCYSSSLLERCTIDTLINLRVFQEYREYIYSTRWREALKLEHQLASLCNTLSKNGFQFNLGKAEKLRDSLQERLSSLDHRLQEAFPPRLVPVREITPRTTKHGTLHRGDFRGEENLSSYSPGAAFTRCRWEEFNPASPQQAKERLYGHWDPEEKTDGYIDFLRSRKKDKEKKEFFSKYGWTLSEKNLSTLRPTAPHGAELLAARLLVGSRVRKLVEWIELYNPETGRIHGDFLHIGSWTHRMAHRRPNMANIPSPERWDPKKSDLDRLMRDVAGQMRELWEVPDNAYLVGTDADGIHSRILAHLIGDMDFTASLVEGRREDGTDIHSRNAKALGQSCLRHGEAARQRAKTFYYAFLNGAKGGKAAEVLECSRREGDESVEQFYASSPGLVRLFKQEIPAWAARGYFESLDGRCIRYTDEHGMLSGILQCAEKIIMARAAMIWMKELDDRGIEYRLVDFVHDEWQTEVYGDRDMAETVGRIQSDAITRVGVDLGLRCPLSGNYKLGRNWRETH